MRHRRIATALFAAAALTMTAACSEADDAADTATSAASEAASVAESATDEAGDATPSEAGTIVDVASANPDFSTLVTAVQAAGLADTLSGDGPFTVFAPTNEAFEALPAGVLDKLLLPENKDTLTAILTYHVLPAEVMAADVSAGDVETVEGSTVSITTDGGVKVNDANVTQTDVEASNGVIHVIDAVLVPEGVDVGSL